MKHFDDSHYRLGRVTNMDTRSNNARIELLESQINEIENNISEGKYPDDVLPEMICEMNTLKNQLIEQIRIKDVLIEEKKRFDNNEHDLYKSSHDSSGFSMMNNLISNIADNYYIGQISQDAAEATISSIKDKWIQSRKDYNDVFIQHTLSNGVNIQIPTNITHQNIKYIQNECERICKSNKLPIQAFRYGYDTYLRLMEGSNPIKKEDVKECDFTMVCMSYKILGIDKIYIRPIYRFNILVNGKTMYISFTIHKNNASDVNWMSSLPRKKVGFR